MMVALLKICSKEELDEGDEKIGTAIEVSESEKKRQIIRDKIKTVAMISIVFNILRK